MQYNAKLNNLSFFQKKNYVLNLEFDEINRSVKGYVYFQPVNYKKKHFWINNSVKENLH